ncbi:MAG: hypothetical protein WBH35_02435 [Bacillota bacterium]|jgi:hypothetical protein|nr:hypothetical protein [Bacillota bacterium]HPZ54966.1 hypothetical protein [Bacillota bacterium]
MKGNVKNHSDSVAVVRVKLTDAPSIDGRKPFAIIAIESDQSLADLASMILVSFGFDVDHGYGFYSDIRRYNQSEERYELSADAGATEGLGVNNVSVSEVFTPGKQMLLLYDYTNKWHFVVRLVRYEDFNAEQTYPAILLSHAIPLDPEHLDDDIDDEDSKYPMMPVVKPWKESASEVRDSPPINLPFVIPSPVQDPAVPYYDPPTIDQWLDLFDAAVAFRDARCYQWMDDLQLFGVEDPHSGSVWYCSIFGGSDGPCGLAAYEGSLALATFLDAVDSDSGPICLFGPNSPRTLLMLLSDRGALAPEDLAVIKAAGVKFHGDRQWPHFRSVLPGYKPWYLTADEAVTMTVLLRQSLEVANKLLEDPDFPIRKDDWALLTRVPCSEGTDNFMDAYWVPDMEPPIPDSFNALLDDIKIKRYGRKHIKSKSLWEISAKWVQEPIQERPDVRPFYPIILVWIDRTTGLVLNAKLTSPRKFAQDLVDATLECIGQYGIIPKEIELDSSDSMIILREVAYRLGIQLTLVDELTKSDIIRDELYHSLKRGEIREIGENE